MSGMRRLQTLLHHTSKLNSFASQSVHQAKTTSPLDRMFSSKHGPALQVHPRIGFADDQLDVRATGLLPGQLVKLQAEVESECQRFKFRSEAMFQADAKGQVIVSEHASLGGTYEGVEPMGLIWSCKPVPEVAHLYPRLKKADSRQPLKYTIKLLDRVKPGNALLASEVVERCYLADFVERREVSTGKCHGVFFFPKQKGNSDPLPVIVELRGLGNGVLEDRASLLASHGYAVLEIDFMASFESTTDLNVFYFDAQAFLDLFQYIEKHPRLDASRVGLFGFCTGSTLALQGICRLNLPLRCTVFSSMFELLLSVVGMKMPDGTYMDPLGPLELFTGTYTKDGYTWFYCKDYETMKKVYANQIKANLPPIENLSVPSLFLIAEDDQYQPSKERMLEVISAMKKAGNGDLVETFHLEGSGHLLDAPYMPICTQSSIKFPTVRRPYFTTWGGTPHLYAHSIEKSWRKVIEYFNHHLKPTQTYR
ncbi:bile acid-CoA:amino acid N-acyltransferase-like [Lytechinus variegatus]|uniref:bile acid-CoA:amino acid N-acyltransferase-like n=1 Tax=Lytechinus variegatus TaxID=7654 RepID=UPI001BB10131|nr:bile acid-CoA:amino acid N-acyltransferase-like [Lytechinus variegatus]XP_041457083.1 bile acid-CoA:amino acid N-acyltransferase-like [Lytechinus variegatus]XP_041457084.1 bile acid-CoA:amino acid N-acyltransferase-like [Lytechinus variegatus]XP_041457085.1 bile acid-CoA:amino acid N-acyltransferase-like [Lytechinus variegatus]